MSLLPEARAVLLAAEQSLRSLVEEAARKGRYADVVQLAEVAQALKRMVGVLGDTDGVADPIEPVSRQLNGNQVKAVKRLKTTKTADFPKFEVNGDRLVKIGWSKREKSEYEHKASREVVLCAYLQLGKGATTEPFRMEEQFPIRMADGTEVPTYQSYLVLAWLRQMGHIEKVGKDSYRWNEIDIDEASFERAWELTIRRSSQSR